MTLDIIMDETITYTSNVPNSRHITDSIELDDDLRNVIVRVTVNATVTTTGQKNNKCNSLYKRLLLFFPELLMTLPYHHYV